MQNTADKQSATFNSRNETSFVFVFQVSLCTPSENTPTESLARLVSMVFQWFHSTAYMMDDEVGSLVEKLKPQFVTKWLKTVCDVRFDVMVMCLLPKPMEFARVRIIYLKVPWFAREIKSRKTICPSPLSRQKKSQWLREQWSTGIFPLHRVSSFTVLESGDYVQ